MIPVKIQLDFLSIQFTKKRYANLIADIFRHNLGLGPSDARPIFYIQRAGYRFPFHQDRKTECSVNVLLDENPDPITFRVEEHNNNMEGIDSDIDEYYETALINTQHWHGVMPPTTTRHLFKVSIFDKPYEECLEIINAWSFKFKTIGFVWVKKYKSGSYCYNFITSIY